jgi:hypothetical protein
LDQSDGGTSNTTLLSDVNSSGSLSDGQLSQTLLVHLSEGSGPSELGRLLLQVEVSASLGVQEEEELEVIINKLIIIITIIKIRNFFIIQ